MTERLFVKDISADGVGIISMAPLASGTVYALTFTLGPLTVRRGSRAVHSHKQPDGTWVIGLAFIEDPTPSRPTIEDLLTAVLSSTISFP